MVDSPYGVVYYFGGQYPLNNLPQKVIDLLVGGNGEAGLIPGGPIWLRPQVRWNRTATTSPTTVNGLPVYPATDTYDWSVVDDLVTRCNAANILICFCIQIPPVWRTTVDINGKTVPFDAQTCKATLATAITVTGVNTPTITINALPTGHTISDQQQITVDYNGASPENVIAQGSYAAGATAITVLNTSGKNWKPTHTHAAGCDVWNSGGQFANPVDTKNYVQAFISRYNGTATNYVTGGAQPVLTVQVLQWNEDFDAPGSNAQRDVQSKWFVPTWQLVGPMVRTHAPNMQMWGPAARRTTSDGSDLIYGLQHIETWTGYQFTYTPPGSSTAGVMPYIDKFDYHYYRGGVGNPDPAIPLPGPTSGAAVPTHAQETQGILGVIAANSAASTDVVCTETGWDVYDDGTGGVHTVSEQQQADFICGPNNVGNLTGNDGVFEQLRKAGATHAFIWTLDPNSVAQTWTDATHPLPTADSTKNIVQKVQTVKGGATVFTHLKAYDAMKTYIAATPSWTTTPPPPPPPPPTPPPPPDNNGGLDMFVPGSSAADLADLDLIAAQTTTTPDVVDRWNRQLGQVDIARALGGVLSAANPLFSAQSLNGLVLAANNPVPNISNIQQFILNAQSYSCCTGQITAAVNQATSWFIPNTNAKNILVWSVRLTYSNASLTSDLRYITADDSTIVAGTSDVGNIINLKGAGAASTSGFAMHHAAAITAPAVSASTLPFDEILNAVNSNAECIANGGLFYIPPSTAGGFAIYTPTTATGKYAVTVRWVEF